MKRTVLLLVLCCGLALAVWFISPAKSQNPNSQAPKHTEIKIDLKLFDEYVGHYGFLSDPDFVLSFWREGEKFFMQPTNQGRIEIFPESDTRFFLKVIEAQATFVRDAQGKVTGVVWRQNGEDNQAKKISSQPLIEVLQPFEKREAMVPMRDGVRLH